MSLKRYEYGDAQLEIKYDDMPMLSPGGVTEETASIDETRSSFPEIPPPKPIESPDIREEENRRKANQSQKRASESKRQDEMQALRKAGYQGT